MYARAKEWEIGEVTVEWYLRRTVDHLHVHAKQIDRNVAAFAEAEHGR